MGKTFYLHACKLSCPSAFFFFTDCDRPCGGLVISLFVCAPMARGSDCRRFLAPAETGARRAPRVWLPSRIGCRDAAHSEAGGAQRQPFSRLLLHFLLPRCPVRLAATHPQLQHRHLPRRAGLPRRDHAHPHPARRRLRPCWPSWWSRRRRRREAPPKPRPKPVRRPHAGRCQPPKRPGKANGQACTSPTASGTRSAGWQRK